jgi:hypothetical protein
VLYRVVEKYLCTWLLQYRKIRVMFKVSPASLRTFIDTRLTLTPSVIPNSNYVIMVIDWNWLTKFCVFLYCNHQVHRDFLIILYVSETNMALGVFAIELRTATTSRTCQFFHPHETARLLPNAFL